MRQLGCRIPKSAITNLKSKDGWRKPGSAFVGRPTATRAPVPSDGSSVPGLPGCGYRINVKVLGAVLLNSFLWSRSMLSTVFSG